MIDDLLAVDRGVDRGHVARGERRRLHEEAHEAEADAVLLLEQILVARRAPRSPPIMSTSLKVVSIAAVFCASLRRRGDGLAQPGHPHPFLAALAGVPAAGPDGGAARRGGGAGGGRRERRRAFFAAAAASTSSLVSRPSLPVPLIFDGSRWCSSTARRTAGDKGRVCRPSPASSSLRLQRSRPAPWGWPAARSGGFGRGRAAAGARRALDGRDHRADRDRVADLDALLAHRRRRPARAPRSRPCRSRGWRSARLPRPRRRAA